MYSYCIGISSHFRKPILSISLVQTNIYSVQYNSKVYIYIVRKDILKRSILQQNSRSLWLKTIYCCRIASWRVCSRLFIIFWTEPAFFIGFFSLFNLLDLMLLPQQMMYEEITFSKTDLYKIWSILLQTLKEFLKKYSLLSPFLWTASLLSLQSS